ncbi:MAG: hypothetical protein NTX32_06145, partial [Candidatus Firestonebacteria bacterium]|nr:hypothetical protein [Candidatus Firestonebacteria bacterium]
MQKKLLAVLIIILMMKPFGYGYFPMINSSARALGMGNAYVGVADDVNSLLGNPAGLANVDTLEATFTGTKLNWGISDMGEGFGALVLPLKGIGAIGAGYYSFSDPGYKESVVYFGYALLVPLFKKTAVGISGKYMSYNIPSSEWTVFNPFFTVYGLSKSSLSFGASIYAQLDKNTAAGIFIDNINTPDVGLEAETLPATIRGGLKYNIEKNSFVTLEGYMRGRDFKVLFGGENDSLKTGDFGVLLFRMGGGAGNNGYLNVTAGLGYRFNLPGVNIGGQVDYGFQFPLNFVSGNSGTHMASITFRGSYKEFMKSGGNEAREEKREERAPVKKEETVFVKAAGAEKAAALKYDFKFTEAVEAAFNRTKIFNILERGKLEEKLKEKKLELSGCAGAECAVEIGRAAGVKQVVIGSVTLTGKVYLVNLRIIDAETSKIIIADMERCRKDEDIAGALQKLVDRISDLSVFKKTLQSIAVMNLEER